MSSNASDRLHHDNPWRDHGHSSPDGVVADADTFVAGQTISQWTQDWWKWALQAPAGAGPLDNAANQSVNQGKMVFIAGVYDATVHAPAHEPILFPMVNAYDTEGPGIETIPNFVADGRGSYADEARYVSNLEQRAIYDAYAKLTKDDGAGHDRTIFDVHLHGAAAAESGVKTGIFALGEPASGGYLENLLQSYGLLPLDMSIKDLPDTRAVGDYAEIKGLQPGTYTLEFGGTGHAVVDPVTNTTILAEGWGAAVKDTLIVT